MMILTNLFFIQICHKVNHFGPQSLLSTLYFRGQSITGHFVASNQMAWKLDQSTSWPLVILPLQISKHYVSKKSEFMFQSSEKPCFSPQCTIHFSPLAMVTIFITEHLYYSAEVSLLCKYNGSIISGKNKKIFTKRLLL